MFRDSGAFSSFSVDDTEAARHFYADVLGLDATMDRMGFLSVNLHGGGRLMMYAKPDHQPASFTVLNFEVPDIEQAVDALATAGVTMVRYPPSEYMQQDEKGISRDPDGPAVAWFTDPAGNTVGVIQQR